MQLDDEPPKKKEGPTPRPLETLGIAELNDYLLWLDAEKERAYHEIRRKQAAQQAAANFFKKDVDYN